MAKRSQSPIDVKETAANSTPDSMEQIREILFGEYQRRVDARLNDARSELQQLRSDEDSARETLDARLSERLDKLDQEARATSQQLEASLLQEISALRKALQQRVDDLHTEMAAEHKRMQDETDRQLDHLETDKVGRAKLASLMRQLADSLDPESGN